MYFRRSFICGDFNFFDPSDFTNHDNSGKEELEFHKEYLKKHMQVLMWILVKIINMQPNF
jgi:hypothetical protein